MSGKFVTDGDKVNFDFDRTPLAENVFIPDPATLKIDGTGFATINSKKVCTVDDANNFTYMFTYTVGAFSTPGSGVIRITNPKTAAYITNPSPSDVLVDAPSFDAMVEFQAPATNPSGSPDPNAKPTEITGTFTAQNEFVSAE